MLSILKKSCETGIKIIMSNFMYGNANGLLGPRTTGQIYSVLELVSLLTVLDVLSGRLGLVCKLIVFLFIWEIV